MRNEGREACFSVLVALVLAGCGGGNGIGGGRDGASGSGGSHGCSTASDCDDKIDCTEDTCVAGGCVHTVVPARCGAGQSCDLKTGCQTGKVCATDTDCNDTDPCTANERCDPRSRVCMSDILDGDGDGHPPIVCGGDDCDDSASRVHPGATEICDGLDNNCDGQVDESPAGQECGPGATCSGGTCACPTPQALCDGQCSDLTTDTYNCGRCSNYCYGGQICSAGACSCLAGKTLCNSQCVDLATSMSDCGKCWQACTLGSQTCVSGACVCATGYHDGGNGACVAIGTCSPGYQDEGAGVCVISATDLVATQADFCNTTGNISCDRFFECDPGGAASMIGTLAVCRELIAYSCTSAGDTFCPNGYTASLAPTCLADMREASCTVVNANGDVPSCDSACQQ